MAQSEWTPLALEYDPVKVGSIDGTDEAPHDRAIIRALKAKYRPNKGIISVPENTVFVSGLNPHTSKDTLEEAFERYGPIKHIRLVRDIVTGFSKRYGFVEYKYIKDAERAYQDGHKLIIDDCEILVDHELERTMPGWKPRRFGGGFGGKKEAGQLRFGGRERPFLKPIFVSQAENWKRRDQNGTSWPDKWDYDSKRPYQGNDRYSTDYSRSRRDDDRHRHRRDDRRGDRSDRRRDRYQDSDRSSGRSDKYQEHDRSRSRERK